MNENLNPFDSVAREVAKIVSGKIDDDEIFVEFDCGNGMKILKIEKKAGKDLTMRGEP